jgi:hypothetical protein
MEYDDQQSGDRAQRLQRMQPEWRWGWFNTHRVALAGRFPIEKAGSRNDATPLTSRRRHSGNFPKI